MFLFRYLDFINVMTYDMHGPWDMVTGHNAPVFPGPLNDGFTVVSKNYRPNATLSQTPDDSIASQFCTFPCGP
jgi:GH18 family chitinase